MPQCAAKQYGDCYRHTEEVDILFKYRDKKGCHMPDEIVKVSLCIGHHKILKKIHQCTSLEMRGEVPEYALHDDLFQHFSNKNRIYTLMHAELVNEKGTCEEHQFYLFRGRDETAMREMIKSWHTDMKHVGVYQEGFFQTTFHCMIEDEDKCNENTYQEVVIEDKKIYGELPLNALGTNISKILNIEDDGNLSAEDLPKWINEFFKAKLDAEKYKDFEECVEFIEEELDQNIVSWNKMHENSPDTERGIFDKVQKFTEALLTDDQLTPSKMFESDELTKQVVLVTYIMANHRLFASSDPKKDLTKNSILIDWMVTLGLEKELLALAISGERERYLMIKRRAHYNILYENQFVVEYLVPAYISGATNIYVYEDYSTEEKKLNPLEYWNYYDNTVCHISNGSFIKEPFEKNEKIRIYLEKHTLGKLDMTLLPKEAMELYEKVVIQNGHPAAEFIILGCPSFFEPNYISVTNGKTATMEDTERFLPGITEMYEQKKHDLRKNDYNAWKFVNDKLRKAYAK